MTLHLQSPLWPARVHRTRRRAADSPPDLVNLVRAVADERLAWEPMVQLPEGTDRWWTRLYGDDRFDLWLLTWLPGHGTDLHDHGRSAAAFAVVGGVLGEVRVERDGFYSGYVRPTGSVTSVPPGVIHDVRGAGDRPAVSIHAYSPPLVRMTYYEPDPHRRLRVRSTLDTREPELEANG